MPQSALARANGAPEPINLPAKRFSFASETWTWCRLSSRIGRDQATKQIAIERAKCAYESAPRSSFHYDFGASNRL